MRRALAILALGTSSLAAADLKPADLEFFEAKIRPVLVAECYECHDAKKQKGDLRLDYRDGLLKGGEEGPSIIPGDAKKSIDGQPGMELWFRNSPIGGDMCAWSESFREWQLYEKWRDKDNTTRAEREAIEGSDL